MKDAAVPRRIDECIDECIELSLSRLSALFGRGSRWERRSAGGRGAGEEGEGRERAGRRRRRNGFNRSNDASRRRGSRCKGGLRRDVSDRAECAVGVVVVAVGVGVSGLRCAQHNDQKNAQKREEKSPRTLSAIFVLKPTHIF